MATYYENVAALAPKVWYKFNETTGTPANSGSDTCALSGGTGAALNQSGVIDKSVKFAGTGTYNFGTLSNVMNDKYFTIELWHKEYANSGLNFPSIFNITKTQVTNYINITYTSDQAGLQVPGKYVVSFRGGATGATPYDLIPANKSTGNEWHHIVFTCSPSALVLYIDGTQVATQANPVFTSEFDLDNATRTRHIGEQGYMYIDELAIYGQTLTAQQVYDNYNSAFNSFNAATALTASALMVQPTVVINSTATATPLTASAASGNHFNSTRDNFTLLDGYMGTLSLEQWYKFDEPKAITNYGTGGNAGYLYSGTARNDLSLGIQGQGALRITGDTSTSIVSGISDANIYSEITDGDFSLGFWVKKSTAQSAVIFSTNDEVDQNFTIEFNSSGYIRANARLQNQNHEITTSTSYANGNWHYVAVRMSGTTMQMWVDGVSKGTVTVTHSFADMIHGDFGSGAGSNTELMYVSQFYIASATNVNGTQIANIWTYGQPTIQGSALMPMPKFSRDNSFNQFVINKSPVLYFKMDEATGLPLNSGSISSTSTLVGSNYTQNILSPNYKAYSISDKDTQITGSWTASSGTFTTDNQQTILFYTKFGSGTQQAIGGAAAFGDSSGQGLVFQVLATGALRLRNYDVSAFDSVATSATFGDGNYHMVIGVKDGANMKIYVDGIERASMSTAAINLTDNGQFAIGGLPTVIAAAASRTLSVDEFAVFNTAFSAQEAFNAYQALSWAMDWTATAAIVAPTYSAGFGPTIAQGPMTASAKMSVVFPPINPMKSDALFLNPNYAATKNTSNPVTVWTASAQGENPGWNIGEINAAIHLDASALFVEPRVLIPGKWNASPAIANPARMVEPAFSSTRGALIKPDPLPAKAFFQLPPAYYLVTDDLWYQRLLEIDYQSETANGLITFFNTSSNIYLAGGYDGWNAHNNRSPFNANYGYNLYDVPLPVATAGYFDKTNRKALNLRNIALEKGDRETPVATWTMELMIQTTKKNQFLTSAFYGGDPSSSVSRRKRTGIRLKDGKIAFTGLIDSTLGMLNSNSEIQFTGFKDIADGEWHHVIIQRRGDGVDQYTPRMQVWIDGKLDIQRFGAFAYCPGQIGYNSNDPDAYSDFNISAISINRGSFVLEREVILNYLASFNIIPVKAPAATATAEIGQDSKAAGNRPRALMLYFWPTTTEQGSQRYPGFTSTESADILTTLDYFTKPPQDYEGWDVFPVDITGRWVSDLVKPEAYGIGNIGTTNFIKDVTPYGRPELADIALVNTAGTFKDPVTDAARYIDLINDIDLSKFDMIMFKNYPNDAREKDSFTGSEVVDAYFNLRESKLFEDFLKTLRAAVDTGLSLMVSNAQLALDLKIVDRVEVVPDMDDNLPTDPYAPTQVIGTGAENLPTPPQYSPPLGWFDTWKNNRTRVVNTHPNITDYPGLIKTQQAFWYNTDEFRWGGPDRIFAKYEHRDALAVGDEFVISTTGQRANQNQNGYLATPFANVKAGKIITAFANTVRRGVDLIENPYRNYAQSIILEPGDVLDGTQVGGKIFVNFTEEINKCSEGGSVELTSDYWVNYAYENGAISLEDRDELLLQEFVTTETPYWSVNGMHLLQQKSGEYELDTDFKKAGVQKETVKVRKVNKNGGISFRSVPQGTVFFSSVYSWQYPMAGFEMPSMPTRGFRWLSNREVLVGTVLRPTALEASAKMPNALGVPDRINNFVAQSMVGTALMAETNYNRGSAIIPVLPATANATIVKPGSTIAATPMLVNAKMFDNSRSSVASEDQVVLYIIHVDPILYIREDVIK